MFILGVPLLIFPFAIYNILVFLMPGFSWTTSAYRLQLMSGADFDISAGDIIVAAAIVILLVEMAKAARISRRTIVDHILSLVLFAGMLAEFLMVKQVASATFLLLLVVSFVDVAGGFTVSIRAARREVATSEVENVHTG